MSSTAGPEPAEPEGVKPYRLSDQERSEAISALADAYAEGRLDVDEFHARMGVASQARLATDLDPLFADLPRRPATPARPVLPALPAVPGTPPSPPWATRDVGGPHRHHHGAPRGFPFVPALFVLMLVTHAWFLIPVLIVAFMVIGGSSAATRRGSARQGWHPPSPGARGAPGAASHHHGSCRPPIDVKPPWK